MRFALVNKDGMVENVIEYDGVVDYSPDITLALKGIPEEKASELTLGTDYAKLMSEVVEVAQDL